MTEISSAKHGRPISIEAFTKKAPEKLAERLAPCWSSNCTLSPEEHIFRHMRKELVLIPDLLGPPRAQPQSMILDYTEAELESMAQLYRDSDAITARWYGAGAFDCYFYNYYDPGADDGHNGPGAQFWASDDGKGFFNRYFGGFTFGKGKTVLEYIKGLDTGVCPWQRSDLLAECARELWQCEAVASK